MTDEKKPRNLRNQLPWKDLYPEMPTVGVAKQEADPVLWIKGDGHGTRIFLVAGNSKYSPRSGSRFFFAFYGLMIIPDEQRIRWEQLGGDSISLERPDFCDFAVDESWQPKRFSEVVQDYPSYRVRLSPDRYERLPQEITATFANAKELKEAYFDHMNRENFPSAWEFYEYDKEREGYFDDDQEDSDAEPCAAITAYTRSAYTRRMAIDDGVLVDVTETAREAGFDLPVALTRAVWRNYVAVPEGIEGQDEAGRLWDVLWMCRHGEVRYEESPDLLLNVVLFDLYVRNDNQGELPLVTLKAVCEPDDDWKPCLTIMRPGEIDD